MVPAGAGGVPLTGRFAEARESLRQLLDEGKLEPGPRLVALNNLAWADLQLEALEEADRCSAEALGGALLVPSFQGTRGALLVLRGDVDAGLTLLRSAFEGNDDPSSRADNACWLSIGELRHGCADEARSWLARAEQLDPHCASLERARAEVVKASVATKG